VLLAVVFALGASLLYALASVLQHRAAIAEPQEHSMRLGLLTRLVRKPLWLVGIACDGLAFVLQFIALGHGSLVLVQPLLVCGLLFALPLGAWLAGTRMTTRDWHGAIALVAGLSLFLLVASPGVGHAEVSNRSWLMLFVFCGGAAAALVLAAQGRSSRHRAALLAGAAAMTYGITAALTKASAHLLGSGGVAELVTSWEAYALLGFGLLGMLLAQSAFQAGPLDASLPVLTVVDPIVSIFIGAFAFGEGITNGVVATPLEVVGLAVVTIGVVLLSRAEAVQVAHEEPAETGSRSVGDG
jgi:drug/metabolite transporter (DMT)-like permease